MALRGSIPTLQAHNTGNYTRVDNVFCTDTILDHIPTVNEREPWNWAKVDWEVFVGRLEEVLGELELLREIETEETLWTALGNFDAAIQQVIKEVVPKVSTPTSLVELDPNGNEEENRNTVSKIAQEMIQRRTSNSQGVPAHEAGIRRGDREGGKMDRVP
ncbi:hypothetical protein C8J55DRAFT_491822 [Lentinula edodes]|uniref:Uncharacterized protein n=1 Tax=Lentinula lateritia TaxID=40482 RepID=A0A9W9DI66_9AGAR|nr:hypothetical protein C8J55DRAFT_491822 [Lentinula edodes]